jgi:hypothetical protein
MGYKELDEIILDHCAEWRMNGPDDADQDINDEKYEMLKAEINKYLDGNSASPLSEEAQEILKEWRRGNEP